MLRGGDHVGKGVERGNVKRGQTDTVCVSLAQSMSNGLRIVS